MSELTRQSYLPLRACEVCGGPLSRRGRAHTGLCARCRMDGAAFARSWATDLRDGGAEHDAIADVVGFTSADEARARISDHRRREATHAG